MTVSSTAVVLKRSHALHKYTFYQLICSVVIALDFLFIFFLLSLYHCICVCVLYLEYDFNNNNNNNRTYSATFTVALWV